MAATARFASLAAILRYMADSPASVLTRACVFLFPVLQRMVEQRRAMADAPVTSISAVATADDELLIGTASVRLFLQQAYSVFLTLWRLIGFEVRCAAVRGTAGAARG